jgi:hypothetical protein
VAAAAQRAKARRASDVPMSAVTPIADKRGYGWIVRCLSKNPIRCFDQMLPWCLLVPFPPMPSGVASAYFASKPIRERLPSDLCVSPTRSLQRRAVPAALRTSGAARRLRRTCKEPSYSLPWEVLTAPFAIQRPAGIRIRNATLDELHVEAIGPI